MRLIFEIDKIGKTYSGKPGCMCGCNGKYSYASDYVVAGGKERGYEVLPTDVSDRSVKIITGKLSKYINELTEAHFASEVKAERIAINSEYVFAEIKNRYVCAYFKQEG